MKIVIALGGNALLRRDEVQTHEKQRANIRSAALSLHMIVQEHDVMITHGNGPQVGRLALRDYNFNGDDSFPLDVLDAETEGMIGYMIEEELGKLLPEGHELATIITRIQVDRHDPAFKVPTKPIGPLYEKEEIEEIARLRGWDYASDGNAFRRVVPSPIPLRVIEMNVIEQLFQKGVTVICGGGGGIPVAMNEEGHLQGIEAVIDKDLASSLIARELNADALIILTDVEGVYERWGETGSRLIREIPVHELRKLDFQDGSMKPKVEAAIQFVENGQGFAVIGDMKDAAALIKGEAGTRIFATPSQ